MKPTPNEAMYTRVLVVDDHPLFRKGTVDLVDSQPDMGVCGEARDGREALDLARRQGADVALLDVGLPGCNGIEVTKQLMAEHPRLQILMLTMHDESIYAIRALQAGARGYVTKIAAETQVVEAIRTVRTGGLYLSPPFAQRLIFHAIRQAEQGESPVEVLSPREREVLKLLGQGMGAREIAAALALSIKTVDTHRARIKEKLGAHDSTELVRFAMDWAIHEDRDSSVARAA